MVSRSQEVSTDSEEILHDTGHCQVNSPPGTMPG